MLKALKFFKEIENFLEPRYYTGGGGDSDVTSRVEPWDEAKPFYVEIYGAAEDAFLITPRTPYTGDFLAGENTYDILSRGAVDDAANAMLDDSAKIRTHAQLLLGGFWLDPTSNPVLIPALETIFTNIKNRFSEEVLPSVVDSMIQSGAFGGTAQDDIIAARLIDFDVEVAKTQSTVLADIYMRERSLQENAPQLFQVAETIDYNRSKLLQANADMVRGLEQIQLDEALKVFEETIKAPWRGISEFSAILTGGGFTNSTVHDPSKQKNVIGSALQGAMGGAATGAGVFGLPGAIAGGLLGGIAGLLG